MKRRTVVCAVFLLVGLIVSAIGIAAVNDVLSRLGISSESAQNHIWYSVSQGYFSYPNLPQLKAIPAGDRAEIVALVGTVARAYVSSADFARRYAEFREENKPSAPEPPPSADEQLAAQRASLEAGIKETEASMKSMPAEVQESMKEALVSLKEQLKQMEGPSPEMEQYEKEAFKEELKQHELELAEWQAEYPEDPAKLVKARLEEFLRESEGVDFSAEVQKRPNGIVTFVNPEYEQKSTNWKLSFRAGKETVEAARAFARSWLNELN